MKSAQKFVTAAFMAFVLFSMTACVNSMTTRERNTAIGAGVGAVVGNVVTDGSTVGTVGGAVAGGVIGHNVR
ncbi:MAG: glycine zipper 2TM domain-containing protein [Gammaproteobacteria bacterium]|nr:glycine zipper 2TM domain-containing protein [Gammaproteobacteria bacterium]MBU1725659.1 glycine zipper 2TM domain-containing protein [Gammaproteobacteria bacterium]MBU2003989.1 glycine zipper 2TM domain-containing protein [Gammaproteobacteria bacterium]